MKVIGAMKAIRVCVLLLVIFIISSCSPTGDSPKQEEDKAQAIAAFLQEKINSGGFNGCRTRVIAKNLIQCDLHFPAGTSSGTVNANTQGVAEMFGQVGLASTIYFAGHSGNLKVCEYKWDMYSRTVKQER